ncbi:MAG: L,D-transpeptidase family protein [Planctomycetes bacterium]|nr:L,D-transpeptidase family protein [Planctomycetota bacterium]
MPSLLFGDDPSRRRSADHGRSRAVVAVIVVVIGLVVVGWGAIRLFSWLAEEEPALTGGGGLSSVTEIRTPGGTGHGAPQPAGGADQDDGEADEQEPPTPPDSSRGPDGTGVRPDSGSSNGGTETSNGASGTQDTREPSTTAQLMLTEGRRLEREGKLVEARNQYVKALAAGPNAAQYAEIALCLTKLSERTILGKKLVDGETEADLYQVQSGDYLSTIGRRYATPYQLIQRINGLSSDAIYAGQKLKVVKGPFRVRVVKSDLVLELWLRDVLVKTYPVAIGKGDSTPAGEYVVLIKQENPAFSPPPSQRGIMKPMAGGDPENPLGSRWIGFGDHLGIHGTCEPDSIGKRVSLGCIRMLNPDVEELYDFLSPDICKVEIVEARPR